MNNNPNPTITIIRDLGKEVSVFSSFLNHPDFPQNRLNIFKIYPKLEEQIAESENEKTAVAEFIKSFYQRHQDKIKTIIDESKKSLAGSDEALRQLGKLMEYQWTENTSYKAYPTVLPFSPFDGDEFFFSILNSLFKNEPVDVLYVAIHEISHFIFFDQMAVIEKKNNVKFNDDLVYYFKESLTTMILNQAPLKVLLGKKDILGNPNTRDIRIKTGGEEINLAEFLKKEFEVKKKFIDFLEKTLLLLKRSEAEFSKKRDFWNKNGSKIFEFKEMLDKYRAPILINSPLT